MSLYNAFQAYQINNNKIILINENLVVVIKFKWQQEKEKTRKYIILRVNYKFQNLLILSKIYSKLQNRSKEMSLTRFQLFQYSWEINQDLVINTW